MSVADLLRAEWPSIVMGACIFIVGGIVLLPIETAYRTYVMPWLQRKLEKLRSRH